MQTGPHLRQLFASILLFCEPMNAASLWNMFKNPLCEDIAYRVTNNMSVHSNVDLEDAIEN